MNVSIQQADEITRPTTTPFTSSLTDHTGVQEIENFGARNDAGLWLSYNCMDTTVPTPICPDPLDQPDKVFLNGAWQPAFTFAMYGGAECKTVGLDRDDMMREVERVYDLNEGRGVEEALLANRFAATDEGQQTMHGQALEWAAPVDLTPGVDVSLRVALALLEGYAARTYVGVPTIHMPRAVASMLGGDVIVWEGDKAFTRMGSKVAMGGGYDVENPTGRWDIFASGEVYVERSKEITVSVTEPTTNTVRVLAERAYRVAVDCFVAKATGTVAPITGGGFA